MAFPRAGEKFFQEEEREKVIGDVLVILQTLLKRTDTLQTHGLQKQPVFHTVSSRAGSVCDRLIGFVLLFGAAEGTPTWLLQKAHVSAGPS